MPVMSMPGCVVEILVLGREEGRLDAVGHRLDRQIEAPLARILGHQRAVGGVDARRHRRLVAGEHLVVRQVLGQVADIDRRPHAATSSPRNVAMPKKYPIRRIMPAPVCGPRSSAGGRGSTPARRNPDPMSTNSCRARYGQNTASARRPVSSSRIMRTTVVDLQRSSYAQHARQPPAAGLGRGKQRDAPRRCGRPPCRASPDRAAAPRPWRWRDSRARPAPTARRAPAAP